MNRRDFVTTSLGASLVPGVAAVDAKAAPSAAAGHPQMLQLRRYLFRFGPMGARFAEYAKGALVPALNRAGIKPVGAFGVVIGPDAPSLYLLLAHPNAESATTLADRI